MLSTFDLKPDYIIPVYTPKNGWKSYEFYCHVLRNVGDIFREIKPNLVIVHGDTSTASACATAAFCEQIPIAHVEAGLRSGRWENPYPEEQNRTILATLARLHFAPTVDSANNLIAERAMGSIYVTGNTVVDSLTRILKTPPPEDIYDILHYGKKIILVTCHRTESFGKPIELLCKKIDELASLHQECIFIWPVHSNPNVKLIVEEKLKHSNVCLTPPLSYESFVHLMRQSSMIITDSGGVIEESSVIGVPTIVLRSEVERKEVLELENVELIGYNMDKLNSTFEKFIHKDNSPNRVIFGDGNSGEYIVQLITKWFNYLYRCDNLVKWSILDEHIFDNIDTPQKAYFLGYIYCDGWVKDNSLCLMSRDFGPVFALRSLLRTDTSIKKIAWRSQGTSRPAFSFVTASKHIVATLKQYGIIPNKTYDHSVDVYIPEGTLEQHFWRGCVDADGCVYVNQRRKEITVVLTNTNKVLLEKFVSFMGSGSIYTTKSEAFEARIHKIASIDKLFENSDSIRMERKYKKYITYKQLKAKGVNV